MQPHWRHDAQKDPLQTTQAMQHELEQKLVQVQQLQMLLQAPMVERVVQRGLESAQKLPRLARVPVPVPVPGQGLQRELAQARAQAQGPARWALAAVRPL